jgi:hypothetical protein
MKKVIQKLRQKDGVSYPFIACLTLALLIFVFGIFEVIRVNIICSNVRDKFQAVIISETTDNYRNMYQPVRDGYAAGYRYSITGWQESSISTRNRIVNSLNDYFNNGEHGQVSVQDVDYTVEMTHLAPVNSESAVQYNLKGELIILIPYRFLWAELPPIRMTVNVRSTWRQLF